MPARTSLLLALVLGCGASHAQTPFVTGLFNTGVNDAGTPMAGYATDPHYRIVDNPVFAIAYASRAGDGSPTDVGSWLGDSAFSSWINPVVGTAFVDQPGITDALRYETRFQVQPGQQSHIRIVGQWAADDSGVAIWLNGLLVFSGMVVNNISWHDFQLESGFVAGENVLAFDTLSTQNPTGLRVEMTASTVPEPGTTALLAAGSLVLAMRRRSQA